MESIELVSSARCPRDIVAAPTLELFAKRAFDLGLASLALLCSIPMLVPAMIAIMLDSWGAPIFTQLRVGQNGKTFRIFKLRTMYAGSDSLDYKTRDKDARLTRVGTWLRRLNLDELPQLFNVLAGDMSIIGPRPLSTAETAFLTGQGGFTHDYPGLIPTMRPGLVGLEQVNRNRNLTYADRFQYNQEYQHNWSLATDWNILFKAIVICSPVCIAVISGAMLFAALLVWGH